MQVVNDHERGVYNGDLGLVRRVDPEEGELAVDFEGREVVYGFGELDELVLAYATTVHKSQGSEYPAVVIPLTTQHYPMLLRNLVYTGVTRGRRLVVLVGQKKALSIAVRGQQTRRRWSKLNEWLRNPAMSELPARAIPAIVPITEAAAYAAESLSAATRRAYRADWADWTTWCRGHSHRALPAAPEAIAAY